MRQITGIRPAFQPAVARWQAWPPRRAFDIEEEGREFEAEVGDWIEPLVAPRAPGDWESDIDPQYPVFGNPLTATVRANFEAAKEEIEDLYRRITALEVAWPDVSIIDGGTW